jgi:hypothetical protein
VLLPALGLAALARCSSLLPALPPVRCHLAVSRWCGTSAAGAAATCSGRPLRCLRHSTAGIRLVAGCMLEQPTEQASRWTAQRHVWCGLVP